MMLERHGLPAVDEPARAALERYIALRMRRPHFANARSVRNALDRARLRQANRLFAAANGPDARGADHHRGRRTFCASRVFNTSEEGGS